MAWRVARSLQVLTNEVRQLHPGTTVWTIGDEAHVVSDHRPNAAGVVCAGDFLPNAGMSLQWFVSQVVASRHPALKYVIYNRRIWSTIRAAEGWRPYSGPNPHTGHVHVSVGDGPDGRSTGPYDDTSPWGLVQEEDDVSWTEELERPDGERRPAGRLLVWGNWAAFQSRDQARENGTMLKALLAQQAGEDVAEAVRAELDRHRAELVAELGEDLAAAVAAELGELPAGRVEQAVADALARTRLTVGPATEGGQVPA